MELDGKGIIIIKKKKSGGLFLYSCLAAARFQFNTAKEAVNCVSCLSTNRNPVAVADWLNRH